MQETTSALVGLNWTALYQTVNMAYENAPRRLVANDSKSKASHSPCPRNAPRALRHPHRENEVTSTTEGEADWEVVVLHRSPTFPDFAEKVDKNSALAPALRSLKEHEAEADGSKEVEKRLIVHGEPEDQAGLYESGDFGLPQSSSPREAEGSRKQLTLNPAYGMPGPCGKANVPKTDRQIQLRSRTQTKNPVGNGKSSEVVLRNLHTRQSLIAKRTRPFRPWCQVTTQNVVACAFVLSCSAIVLSVYALISDCHGSGVRCVDCDSKHQPGKGC